MTIGATRLLFSVAIDASSPVPATEVESAARVVFTVHVDGVSRWKKTLPLMPKNQRRWWDGEIELDRGIGESAGLRLRFETLIEGALVRGIKAGFGRPRIVQARHGPRRHSSRKEPNVVLILVDTLRADHLGVYGYPRDTAPFLNELAGEGVVFDQAISTSSWTWPAVASLFTGLDPPAHGVLALDRCFLADSLTSLAECCAALGISTFGCAANPLICREKNFDQGFEEWKEFYFRPADWVAGEFETFARKRRRDRFFAYLHFVDPHHPYAPPEEYRERFARPGVDVSINDGFAEKTRELMLGRKADVPDAKGTQDLIDLYDGEIAFVDAQIRVVCEVLRKLELWDRTIVVVTGDHGEEFRDHGGFNHAWTLYQELVRVPLIVREPGTRARRVPEPVSLKQIPATVLSWLGSRNAPWTGSIVLSPWSSTQEPRPAEVFSHTARGIVGGRTPVELFAVQTDSLKLIVDADQGYARGFDLAADPGEQTDVIGDDRYRDAFEAMRSRLARWREEMAARAPTGDAAPLDPATEKMLQSLGYLDEDGARRR